MKIPRIPVGILRITPENFENLILKFLSEFEKINKILSGNCKTLEEILIQIQKSENFYSNFSSSN